MTVTIDKVKSIVAVFFSSNYAPTSTPNTVTYDIEKSSCGESKDSKLKNWKIDKLIFFRCL